MENERKFTVKIRRIEGAEVRLNAEQLDGKTFNFVKGWMIESSDSKFYAGEVAMLPRDVNYPTDAPHWIASGDLIPIEETDNRPAWGVGIRSTNYGEIIDD